MLSFTLPCFDVHLHVCVCSKSSTLHVCMYILLYAGFYTGYDNGGNSDLSFQRRTQLVTLIYTAVFISSKS